MQTLAKTILFMISFVSLGLTYIFCTKETIYIHTVIFTIVLLLINLKIKPRKFGL